jgi:hypothetical protein
MAKTERIIDPRGIVGFGWTDRVSNGGGVLLRHVPEKPTVEGELDVVRAEYLKALQESRGLFSGRFFLEGKPVVARWGAYWIPSLEDDPQELRGEWRDTWIPAYSVDEVRYILYQLTEGVRLRVLVEE